MAFILGQTARGGRPAGFAAMFGIWTGAFVHVAMATIGLSAILATSALAFSVVKWAGAIYLIWLGIQALRSKGGGFISDAGPRETIVWPIFRQGVVIATLNPKVAIFFLAFLPQFIVIGAGPDWAQLLLHGTLVILAGVFIEPFIVMAGAGLARTLRNSQRLGLWLDRALGGLFIALGVRLALVAR
jgi:threonine/homoserine/homoserine lactone efflux protein